jgi:Fe-S oxidoreductase
VAEKVMLLEEFLLHRVDDQGWHPEFSDMEGSILVHGHCHQKSLVGSSPMMRLLRMPPGFTVQELDSGCCGMAGSFGYEKEHYDLSLQIGELSLFPAIRNTPRETKIVASGLSCRQQILHATGRKASHFAEILSRCLPE